MIRQWLKDRKAEKRRALFDKGFDYAAGQLLRDRDPEELEREADAYDRNDFDYGMDSALSCWRAVRQKYT